MAAKSPLPAMGGLGCHGVLPTQCHWSDEVRVAPIQTKSLLGSSTGAGGIDSASQSRVVSSSRIATYLERRSTRPIA